MSLSEAISDLKTEVVKSGVAALADENVAEIAGFYSIHPSLLRRKFDESFPKPELLAQTAAACDPIAAAKRWSDESVDFYCRRYGVSREVLWDGFYQLERHTIIGRIDGGRWLAIRHSDGSAWRIPMRQTTRLA